MSLALGCLADDFTGATDVANGLARAGLRTLLTIGVPNDTVPLEACDALVIALKTRSIPPGEAVDASLSALEWLRSVGCDRFYFKYASTFDSTQAGNIGPVTEALLQRLGEPLAVACPAFPATGRKVVFGHLFVHGVLLNESGMECHPLNPMTDANLVRVLAGQCQGGVGLIDVLTVQQGESAVSLRLAALEADGSRHAVVDAFDESHLETVAAATAQRRLNAGAAGFAAALAARYTSGKRQRPACALVPVSPPLTSGARVVLAGSCSATTRRQIEFFSSRYPVCRLSVPALLADAQSEVQRLLQWAEARRHLPCLIYSTDLAMDPARTPPGTEDLHPGRSIERAFGQIASRLVADGVTKLVVAGGETAGAAVRALRTDVLHVGAQIDPGVPWMLHRGPPTVALALKSGNFGADDFFVRAFDVLEGCGG